MKIFEKAWARYTGIIACIAIVLMLNGHVVYSAVSQVVGISVELSNNLWTKVVDAAKGDGITSGILGSGLYFWNGTSFDRARGTIAGGLIVQQGTTGTAFYAIKRSNLTTGSINLAFGFTSNKVAIQTDSGNTDEVCIDYLGGTAACPAANTAGNDRMSSGATIILDNFARTSLSFIAASGTQTIYVRAWQ